MATDRNKTGASWIMEEIKVNFEIVGVNSDRGVTYVKYWADGATVQRFHADIGPYEIPIPTSLADLSTDEVKEYFAKRGYWIVKRQKDAMDAEINGSTEIVSALLNIQSNTIVDMQSNTAIS